MLLQRIWKTLISNTYAYITSSLSYSTHSQFTLVSQPSSKVNLLAGSASPWCDAVLQWPDLFTGGSWYETHPGNGN